ncbi:MAG: PaaX domain-containing protein, C- domain protein [Actinomycetota bacterium]
MSGPSQTALSTRSVLLSGLLGTEPPRLPVSRLIRLAALFGSSDGAVRTALSRLVAAGELEADDGWYELSPRLVARQERQDRSRRLERRPWDGSWRLLIVRDGRRERADRDALRRALTAHRHGELREGVWGRPDNLVAEDPPEALGQCELLVGARPEDPVALATGLWDLAGWTAGADELREQLAPLHERIVAGDEQALRPGFELAAAVLRHLLDDPALPTELHDDRGAAELLREDYDAYDRAFRALLLDWLSGG